MTGGLQEQVIGGKNQFGIPLYPSSKSIIGSQNIPWIYEDRLNGDDVVDALENKSMPEFGDDVIIKKFEKSKGWLAKKLSSSEDQADKLVSILEERSIWQRYGF